MIGAPEKADVIIIGGGVMGSGVAYFLKHLGGPSLSVTVCEADVTYRSGASLASAGCIRQTFSLRQNVLMSQFGVEFLKTAGKLLEVEGQEPDVAFVAAPYLYLAAGKDEARALRRCIELRHELGAGGEWLDRIALQARFPLLETSDIDAGLLGGDGEGTFDPEGLLRGLKRKAIAQGVRYVGERVVDISAQGVRVTGVRLGSGVVLEAGCVVNAAGPWASDVGCMTGDKLPVIPTRSTSYLFTSAHVPSERLPIVVDRGQGLNFKAEGNCYLATLPKAADGDHFEEDIWPALAHRVPAFEAIRFSGQISGTLDRSPFDGSPFIGLCGKWENLYVLAGFNGHGLQHAPAAGRGLAELIVLGQYRSIDLTAFSPARVTIGEKAFEWY